MIKMIEEGEFSIEYLEEGVNSIVESTQGQPSEEDPQYAKQGLFDVYIEKMKDAVKETKMAGLTIKGDNDK